MICLRTGRLASGLPIGLAFTSEASLRSVLGPRQQWTLICEPALLDASALVVEPDTSVNGGKEQAFGQLGQGR